ncbi:MAG: hypothetical protein HOP12_07325, partial [Candidatus Eisenbacteria bacterium]|nr:hypothetical protein [Candidatus Eisenbacteria bacterium]
MTSSLDRRLEPRAEFALVVIAMLARLVLAMRLPADHIPWSDGREFAEIARSLIDHGSYGLQTLRPPGYPTFMAAVWALAGESLPRLRAVECVLGTLAVWWIGRCGAAWFGRRAGLIAMALAALHPVLAFLPGTQYSENLLVLVMVFAWGVLLTALLDARAGLARWAIGGALMGIAVLIRPNAVLLLPGFAVAAAIQLAG